MTPSISPRSPAPPPRSPRLTTGALLLAGALGLLLPAAAARAATAAPSAAHPTPAPALPDLLAASLRAAGGAAWDRVDALRLQGRLSAAGLSGTIESLEDLRSGRYVVHYDLGVAKGAQGFDGEHPWALGGGGEVTVQTAQEDLEAAHNEAWRTARAFWFPNRWPAELAYDRTVEEGAASYHVVRVHPRDGREMELWLDVATLLPARGVERGGTQTTTTTWSDWRLVAAGILVPYRVASTTGHPGAETEVVVEAVEVVGAPAAADFAPPAEQHDDFTIAGDAASVTMPFELLNNHIYVLASVDGTAPRPFLVDTGGVNLLTRAAADQLGITSQGALSVGGVGEQREQAGMARLGSFAFGGITLREPLFYVMPFGGVVEAEGVELAGLIGFEVFERFAVTIDYARSLLTLTRPEAFAPPPGAIAVPFRFQESTVLVDGSLDGIAGTFTIDTGSRSTLDLLAPFVAEHDLTSRYAPKLETVTGWGVGGPARSRVARAGRLMLGEAEVSAPIVELTLQKGGAFTHRYVAGNVGTGVLKRFTVTFDYARQRMYLQPGGVADPFDRSGVWLNDAGEAFRVEALVEGGPGAAAGLAVGDRVVAIDGTSAAALRLPEVRRLLAHSPPGTVVRLRVERDGAASREVDLVLRELI